MRKDAPKSRRVLVGRFDLGPRRVTVYALPHEPNGYFNLSNSEIVVGLKQAHWADVASVLIHEAIEFALTDQRCRFSPSPDWGNSNDGYLFVFDHPQLSELGGRVGWFLAEALPALATHYNRSKRKRKVR